MCRLGKKKKFLDLEKEIMVVFGVNKEDLMEADDLIGRPLKGEPKDKVEKHILLIFMHLTLGIVCMHYKNMLKWLINKHLLIYGH